MIFPVLVRLKRKLMLFPFKGVLGRKVQPSVAFAMIKRSGEDHRSKKDWMACRCLRQKIKWKCLELKISENLLKVMKRGSILWKQTVNVHMVVILFLIYIEKKEVLTNLSLKIKYGFITKIENEENCCLIQESLKYK